MSSNNKSESGGSGAAKASDFQGKIMVGNTTANDFKVKVVTPQHASPNNDRSKASLPKE